MTSELKELFGAWIGAVAGAVDAGMAGYARPRQILLTEGEGGTLMAATPPAPNRPALPDLSFALMDGRPQPPMPADWTAAMAGSRIEILLQPGHVMFQSLDFPRQAGDFLDGVIRAQIDRLTPWTAHDAIFAW